MSSSPGPVGQQPYGGQKLSRHSLLALAFMTFAVGALFAAFVYTTKYAVLTPDVLTLEHHMQMWVLMAVTPALTMLALVQWNKALKAVNPE